MRRGGGKGRGGQAPGRLRRPREPEAPPTAADLRAWLAARLPEPLVPAAFVTLPVLAALHERQGGPACLGEDLSGAGPRRRDRGAAHAGPRRSWPSLGGGPGRPRGRGPGRLLRSGRPLASRHPARLPRPPGLRRRPPPARPLRGADRRGAGPPGRSRREGERSAHRPGPAGRRAAPALLRPGAALVPGPARPRHPHSQHAGVFRLPGAGRGDPLPRPWTRSCGATSRCAPPSAARRGPPSSGSRRRFSLPLPVVDLSGLAPGAVDAEAGADRGGGGRALLRPRPRAAAAHPSAPPGRGGAGRSSSPFTTSSRTAGPWAC